MGCKRWVLWFGLVALTSLVLGSSGCSGGGSDPDAGTDGGIDAGTDGETDAGDEDETITVLDDPVPPGRGFFLGLLPSPALNQGFAQAHADAAQTSELVPVWGRPSAFWELLDDLSGDWGQTFLDTYIRGEQMVPLIHLSFMDAGETLKTPPDLPDASLADPSWRARYTQAALDATRTARPAFLSLGNEVNRWYEVHGVQPDDPNSFLNYVSLYEEIYDQVKALSPDTLVFCTFNREMVAELREADLQAALALFNPDKLDLVVLTSYPWAVAGVNLPSQVADDYYSAPIQAAGLASKPFGFSEFAWASIPAIGGEAAQAKMLRAAAERLSVEQGLDLFMIMWPWMHDLDEVDDTGLRQHDGAPKLAWQDWLRLSSGEQAPTRQAAIPAQVVKGSPQNDLFPPVLHAVAEFEACVPLEGPVNTAGLEDSPYISPDGSAFFFTFLPDAQATAQEQLLDGVTGIYRSDRVAGSWAEPVRVRLNGDLSLDGCPTVDGDLMWFCSIRAGNYGEGDLFTAGRMDGEWTNWENAGEHINQTHDFGEMHLSADGQTMWFHRTAAWGGQGDHDLWSATRQADGWSEPVNLGPMVNDDTSQAQPFVSRDESELWFTSPSKQGLTGPAVWRSRWLNGAWTSPEEMVANFAGEPNLDTAGNLYFVHHFFDANIEMVEADIYFCARK